MRNLRLVILITVSCFLGAFLPAQDFTLEQILSAPFPSSLSAAPSGGHVAWVMNEKGARNVWIASPPDYQGRRLTAWDQDDGLDISSVRWTPEAARLVFVRGQGPNRQGEFPNPRHRLDEGREGLWTIETTAGAEARYLTGGSNPVVTPEGDKVLFLRRGDIWEVKFESDAEPEQITRLRGTAGSLRWSPDGSKLAFVSRRGDHSFIVLWERGEDRVRFLDPGVDRDSNPVWSPDGERIAFLRVPARRKAAIFSPDRECQPWQVRVVEVESGIASEVFRADPGKGSCHRSIVAENNIFWSSDGRLVFAWEKSGWNQLYSVPAEGGEVRHLTPGEFEVEYATLSQDGLEMIYNSNQGDLNRRHLWRVATRGGPPQPLTAGRQIEWAPTPTTDPDVIAFFRSSATRPARPAASVHGREVFMTPDSLLSNFPSTHLVEPHPVLFSAADGLQIHGQLFLPPRTRSGDRRPAMLYFHGGSRRQMLLGFHYSNYYHNAYAMNQYLANRGFVVLSVNYRSGIGYGMEFREALEYGASGASEFNDVLGGGLFLRGRDEVDPDRIGLWGGSYGGYLTALGLARASHLFAAGVDLHGVHDWNPVIRNFVPSYNPLEEPERARVAFRSSPLSSVDTWRSPVLLIHGDDDRNVPFSETIHLVEELRKRNIEFEQLIFPDEVHGFLLHESWIRAFDAAADFLKRKLGK